MALVKKSKQDGKANKKYFESYEVLKQLDEVKEWLQKNGSKKVRLLCHKMDDGIF
jgi:hypothetical protein